MSVTSTSAPARARAHASPPNPPPTMTTRRGCIPSPAASEHAIIHETWASKAGDAALSIAPVQRQYAAPVRSLIRERLSMTDTTTKPKIKDEIKVERPRLHKVILVNDDFTPREFVVTVLKAEFRMTEDQAHKVMITAHQRGVCVVAVFTKDVAETKATRATDAGRAKGYPLLFTTEPEE